ncbi:MAG: pyridoxal phosphate-dependent aminotransferase [Bacilli bacterium]
MKILAKHAQGKILKGDAFQISTAAKNAKKNDPSVIDCTLGIYLNEEHEFKTFPTVKKYLHNLPDDLVFDYSTSDGGLEFADAVINWVLGSERQTLEKTALIKAIPTPGGTGALNSLVANSLDEGETLLFPNLSWGPYTGIAQNRNLKIEKYSFFKNNKFNLNGFMESADKIIEREGKLVTIINDPCNNPTGYTLNSEELQTIINYINFKNVPTLLIYDAAYLDFAYESRLTIRQRFGLLERLDANTVVGIAFSASKSFAAYGQRLGAQILIGKDQEMVNDLYNAANFTARNNWSNCNKGLINLIIGMNKDKELKEAYLKELNGVVGTIKKRSQLFLEQAKAINLITFPYHGGFFVTIPCKDRDLALELLKNNAKLYLLPFESSVRVALCSVALNDVDGLALRIKQAIGHLQE